MRSKLRRGCVWLAALSMGGSPFVLSGCDPQVRDTVLGGVQGASQTLLSTFVQAFFESLTPKEDEDAATTI
jgi:hypothetical protein